ncbi:hypothetical protein Acr_00g0040360 [Actinidia rufa]|uniref:Uncharacterized protein n=1 Tax=Actinidia rufa TaxID=165716 RepID=A0A7J0DHV1_9ERIC|nr:hypothetical protein Acr_00g0040360 [Actinidia rufa]
MVANGRWRGGDGSGRGRNGVDGRGPLMVGVGGEVNAIFKTIWEVSAIIRNLRGCSGGWRRKKEKANDGWALVAVECGAAVTGFVSGGGRVGRRQVGACQRRWVRLQGQEAPLPRRRLRHLLSPPPDPVEEENCWRERKKGTLAKLKEKYQNEIDQRELLSITLWALQQRAQKQQCRERTPATTTEIMSCDLDFGSPHPPRDSSGRRRVDDLILKVTLQFFNLIFCLEEFD